MELRPGEPRIVSLIASSTEILCALGFERNLVGRSHECDFPESVRRLPACTAPRIDTRAGSREIDRSVKALLESALSVYRVDAELLRSLRPTHIVTQTQCEVCAVSLKDVRLALLEWTAREQGGMGEGTGGPAPEVVSLEPGLLGEVWEDIRRVAEALGAPERGTRLVEGLESRMRAIEAKARALPGRPRVANIEWIDPLMAAGNWMPELVSRAGGRNLFGEAGKHSPDLRWEELVAKDPDVILVSPCGLDIRRTRDEMPALTSRPGWGGLRAVKERRVHLVDGNLHFHRPGPRLVESLEILAEILQPGEFDFGHRGKGWMPFQ